MMLIKWMWWLIGFGVAAQYTYWAAMEIGYGLGWNAPPIVSHDWLFLAFGGAAILSGERVLEGAKKLLQ